MSARNTAKFKIPIPDPTYINSERARANFRLAIYLGPGIAVWLFARASIHIGASGLVYGLVSYRTLVPERTRDCSDALARSLD